MTTFTSSTPAAGAPDFASSSSSPPLPIYQRISRKLSQHIQLISLANPTALSHGNNSLILTEIIKEIDTFLQSIQAPQDSDKVISWFEMITRNCLFHLQTFHRYHSQVNDLMRGIDIVPSEEMDCQSEVCYDLEAFCEMISSYLITSCSQKKKRASVEVIHQKALMFLIEWNRQTESISKLKVLSENIFKLFQTQVEARQQSLDPQDATQHSTKIEPQNVVCAELDEIIHILEDLIHSPIQFPQQFALVDSLNDSFMKYIHGFDNHLLEPFSHEINRLHDTMKILHQLSVLPLLSVDRFHQLYACIGRRSESEYVEKEESLRRETLNQLEVAISQVTLEEFPDNDNVGITNTGHFSDLVVRGRVGNRALSVKVYHTTKSSFSNEEIRSMENEVLLMSLLHHSSILQTYGYCKADLQTTYLLLESAPIGSLWSVLIDTDRTPSIPLSLSLGWISDILSALCYLHDKRIIHGDVRAENVMLSDGLICKLTNCGSTPLLPPQSSPRSESDLLYMAPEVRMDGRRSHRSDMYSFGLTSYQILERTHPPHCMPRQHVLLYASSLSVLPLVGFFEGCLKETPVERMSSREALDLIRSTQESEEFIGDPRQCRESPNYEEVQVTSKSLLYCQKHQDVTTDDSSSHPVSIPDLSLYSSLYMMSRCGNRRAFEQLEILSQDGNEVSSGYLMLLLYSSDIPSIFPQDQGRAMTIAHDAVPKLKSKFREEMLSARFSWWLVGARYSYRLLTSHELFILGRVFELALGVEKNMSEAVKLYQLASNQGHSLAQYHLGMCFECGNGVTANLSEAVKLYKHSSDHGNPLAQWNLGLCYEQGLGVVKSLAKAVRYYELSSEQGFAPALCHLAVCYEKGSGVDKDPFEAVRLYKAASIQGSAVAQYHLGVCYEKGIGVSVSLEDAFHYYLLSSKQGYSVAQCQVGVCYENGIGVEHNLSEARRFYSLAGKQGYKSALQRQQSLVARTEKE